MTTSIDPTTNASKPEALTERSAVRVRLGEILAAQRADFLSKGAPSAEARRAALKRLSQAVSTNRARIEAAIRDDFGSRSAHESRLVEVLFTLESIQYDRDHLEHWMQPRGRQVSLAFQPASARIVPQPLGIVGVIAPWNYPVNLALVPLSAALAAGNRVMLKPSEFTPHTADLLAEILGGLFDETEVAVVRGEADVGAAFASLPFDHLLFTGATSVGRAVMRAAAENLTPVTLELGGKSPCIVGADHNVEKAAAEIATGKLLNAGQTCIAPDYVLVPEDREEAFIAAYKSVVAKLYPTLAENPDYTSIVNDRHYARVRRYVDEAKAGGAEIIEINPANETLDPARRKMAPTLIRGVTSSMAIAEEEIFGPVLPVFTYRQLNDAIAHINARPRPLALYLFSNDEESIDRVLARTTSGGVSLNSTALHFTQETLPFGGVGASGMGAYHGESGFKTFSHEKSVFQQAPLNATPLLRPPFGRVAELVLQALIRKASW